MKKKKDNNFKILNKFINEEIGEGDKVVAEDREHLEQLLEESKEGEIKLDEIDVSNVEDMYELFLNWKQEDFNGSVSNWNVSNVEDMESMFKNSEFNQDISNWNVSNVENMESMFAYSDFNQDLSSWDVTSAIKVKRMFENCPIEEEYLPYDNLERYDKMV